MNIKVFSDGGARGNPGPAGIGAVVLVDDKSRHEISEYIGETTNNQAEYQALISALIWIGQNLENYNEINCFLDSQLVVEQLNQRYKINNEGLKPLFWQVRDLVLKLGGNVTFSHIPREQNKEADKLVNLAVDKALNIK